MDNQNIDFDETDSEQAAGELPAGSNAPRSRRNTGIGTRKTKKGAHAPTGEAVTSLGIAEAEVMAALWDIAQPATEMQIIEHSLYKRRSQGQEPFAFGTVATTLRRLVQKGLLVCQKNARHTLVYAPVVGREEMAARVLNHVSESLLGRSLHALLPRLTGSVPTKGVSMATTGKHGKHNSAPGAALASGSAVPSTDDVAVDALLDALEALAAAEGQDKPPKAG